MSADLNNRLVQPVPGLIYQARASIRLSIARSDDKEALENRGWGNSMSNHPGHVTLTFRILLKFLPVDGINDI